VAAGAYADTLTVSLGPAPNSTGIGNLIVGDTAYVLSLVDSTGASVTTFDQPLVLMFTPSADDLAAAGDDPLAIVVSVYNADTGEFEVVPTTLNDDGTVSAVVASIGMPVEARRSLLKRRIGAR
jgi:hypothetical protein